MYQQLLSTHCWDQLEMNLYQERCHASFSPSSCMYLHPTWMDWCSILVILYVAKIMGLFALSLNMQMARVCHLHPEAVQWWLGPHHQDISLGLEQVQCSQSLTSLPGLSNDHMHSLASRLFLVTSFTCSTCYKQQSQLRPGNEASLLTVSISRSYSEWADLRLMLGVELTCCAWSNKHQKCWFAGLLQERSWFNKREAASLASCWKYTWIYDNLHLRLLGDFFPDSNPPCLLRALGRG